MQIELELPFHPVIGYSTNNGNPSQIVISGEAIIKIAEQIKESDLITFSWQALQDGKHYEIYAERK